MPTFQAHKPSLPAFSRDTSTQIDVQLLFCLVKSLFYDLDELNNQSRMLLKG